MASLVYIQKTILYVKTMGKCMHKYVKKTLDMIKLKYQAILNQMETVKATKASS
jgi:hypothetical protein